MTEPVSSNDVLQEAGYLALGSRLKRLAERLQTDAGKAHADQGFPMKPSQFPVLATLAARGPLTVGELVEALGVSQPAVTRTLGTVMAADLIEARRDAADQRIKRVRLTDEGAQILGEMKRDLWPHIHAAAAQLVDPTPRPFLEHLRIIEARLEARSLAGRIERHRSGETPPLRLVPWRDELAPAFAEITRAWVEDMFSLEENDRLLIEDQRRHIVDRGGLIVFAELEGVGIVGTCALVPVEGRTFELTKMGVLEAARGRKAGDFLLRAILERARSLHERGELEGLFLLTNRRCAAAIHLYEKYGFVHDADILARYAPRYARCNVAMSYPFARDET